MKGGKAGRARKSATTRTSRPDHARGAPKKGAEKHASGGAPKKGSRKKPGYGGSSSSGEE